MVFYTLGYILPNLSKGYTVGRVAFQKVSFDGPSSLYQKANSLSSKRNPSTVAPWYQRSHARFKRLRWFWGLTTISRVDAGPKYRKPHFRYNRVQPASGVWLLKQCQKCDISDIPILIKSHVNMPFLAQWVESKDINGSQNLRLSRGFDPLKIRSGLLFRA